MGRLTDLELLDTHDGRSRQLKQRIAEVRKELEAAHGGLRSRDLAFLNSQGDG